MKCEVGVSPEAAAEIDAHAEFIAVDSVYAALRFYGSVERAFVRLSSMPEIGAHHPVEPSPGKGLRVWPVPGFPRHLIFYRSTTSTVEIVRLIHSSRDIPGLFAESGQG